ncbi:MAG: HlyD family efflux transporter periplasmic adaptor subunit [Armatimonadota bacterium]|nr:HlyD family efflux transporter periplasmic adaptor subunit [Armatimonadota bacterium]MDW8143722.1 HlyD family efflux transporter periplasmic adaptor subunit [Armatimonadota bacterium]
MLRWLRKRKWLVVAIVLVIASGAGFWWWRKTKTATPAKFAIIQRETLTLAVREVGTIEPLVKVAVKSKVAGRIMAIRVQEGDFVRKGQVIAIIDPTELERQVNQVKAELTAVEARWRQALLTLQLQETLLRQQWEQAHADLIAAQANLEKLMAGARPEEVEAAEANVKKAKAQLEAAQKELERQRKLFENRAIAYQQAEAELKIAEANLQKLLSGARPEEIAAAEADLKRAQAALEEARKNLERQKRIVEQGLARQQAEAELQAAEANLENAKQNLERKRSLYEKGFVSKQELDSAEATYQSSLAQVKRAQAALEQVKLDEQQTLAAAQARYEAALQEVKAAQERLNLLRKSRQEDIVAARAQVERAKAMLKSAMASEDQALDNAQTRYQAALQDYQAALAQMRALKSARPEDLKAAEAQVNRAKVALKSAEARLREKQNLAEEVKAAWAQVQRLREQLANLQTQLRDTVITAPISGVVIRKSVEVGELVASAISGFAQGTELVTIADLSQLVVRVRLNEVDVARIYVGQPAEIRVDAVPEKVFKGTVSKIAPAALDRLLARSANPAANQGEVAWFDVEIKLNETHPDMKLGMSANVDIVAKKIARTLTIPLDAIVEEEGNRYALLVTDQQIARQVRKAFMAGRLDELVIPETKVPTKKVRIRIGLKNEAKAQLISGLKEGDVLLVKPPKRRVFEIEPPHG